MSALLEAPQAAQAPIITVAVIVFPQAWQKVAERRLPAPQFGQGIRNCDGAFIAAANPRRKALAVCGRSSGCWARA